MEWYSYNKGSKSLVSDRYFAGCRHSRYYINSSGQLRRRVYFQPRQLGWEDELAWRLGLLEQVLDRGQGIVMFNQVWPLDHQIRDRIEGKSSRNIYMYREDKYAQLSSFVIAKSTGQWVKYREDQDQGVVDDIDSKYLDQQIHAYREWDSIDKTGGEIVKYEDINFVQGVELPLRQNRDHASRLSSNMLKEIELRVAKYRNWESCVNSMVS